MDLRRADLHTHTVCSDGMLAPEALVYLARERGLAALAVTDHDTVEGLEAAMAAGRRLGVEVIPGVELSVHVRAGTAHAYREVHLLGYFFDPAHPALRACLDTYRRQRRERGFRIVERLHDLGVPLRPEAVLAQAGDGVIGRPHVARALVAGGFAASYGEAFAQYLADEAPAFVPKPPFPFEEALALLHEAGGIGVLAHPGHWTSSHDLQYMIRAGLDGIETVHPAHDAVLTRYYRDVVRDFLLIETGGSDYHGLRDEEAEHFGKFGIPYARLEPARRRACTGMAQP
ncbi:PHP domain-containing protein [Rhodocaloribacter litoris]|uniref:PHP domain-containing protein n=1 Tax=Rhodocaloribacter litoris TaxID=2558931 RepID=UPI001E605D9F|nr:PHP domain-containing protein [Rhodocaloribacter litoris]QXD15216.1 PHP domain-containing protein [Rhodocaloribacter litoris]